MTDADQIVFLADGQVTGVGTHTELLAGNPGYAKLYRLHQQRDTPATANLLLQPELI